MTRVTGAMDQTVPSAPNPGLKVVSNEPSLFRRAMRWRSVPLNEVKLPPMRMRPSGCSASAEMKSFGPLLGATRNEVSGVPLLVSRAIRA